MPPNHRQVCMHEQFNMHQLIMSYYKIMGSRIGNHFRVRRTWAPRGSASGLRVQGSTGSVFEGRLQDEELGVPGRRTWCGVGGRIGLALVDVVLVVVKTLSGPRVGSD